MRIPTNGQTDGRTDKRQNHELLGRGDLQLLQPLVYIYRQLVFKLPLTVWAAQKVCYWSLTRPTRFVSTRACGSVDPSSQPARHRSLSTTCKHSVTVVQSITCSLPFCFVVSFYPRSALLLLSAVWTSFDVPLTSEQRSARQQFCTLYRCTCCVLAQMLEDQLRAKKCGKWIHNLCSAAAFLSLVR